MKKIYSQSDLKTLAQATEMDIIYTNGERVIKEQKQLATQIEDCRVKEFDFQNIMPLTGLDEIFTGAEQIIKRQKQINEMREAESWEVKEFIYNKDRVYI